MGLSSFLILTAIISFALSIWGTFSGFYVWGTIATVLVVAVALAYWKGRLSSLPDTFIDELSSENEYGVRFCSSKSLREADELTRPYFGSGFIPFNQLEQWRLRNPKGFVEIGNSDGVLCGCFVILGLERSFLDQFIVGRVEESQIDSNVVLSFSESKSEDRVYICGIVVRQPGGYMGGKRARVLLWAMLHYIKTLYGLRKKRTFYALALTPESERLLKNLEFELCCHKEHRKDKCNLYRKDLDRNTWMNLSKKVGDCSSLAKVEWQR